MCRYPPHGRNSHVIGGNSLLGVGGPIWRWVLLIAALVTALAVVTVPASTALAQQPCDNGVAVPNPSANSGLVADCNTLLSLKDTLAGTATLNWSENTAIANWDGIAVSGSPQRVTELNLESHGLTGTIPTELGEVASLQKLRLSGNALTGLIPSDIGDLVNLEGLWLSTNQLTGTIPRELGNLGNMQDMSLTNNQLTGSIPPELGNLVNLEVLHLFGNQLTGSIPSQLGSLVNLRSLWLNANQLTGSIPKELGNLVNLEQLVLVNNALTGSIPSELGGLVNLQRLRLDRNQFTGSIPTELGNLVNLQILRLDRNQLTGSIPLDLLSLTDLKQLQLHNNELTGSIPSELGNLTTLEGLWLSNNQLTGSIPSELGSLANLTNLWLSGNQLTGSVPSEFDNLTNLRELWLSNNQLTGSIPSEFDNLTNLRELWLSNNQLTGSIPPGLSNLAKLEELNLHNNRLIPPVYVDLTELRKLTLDFSENYVSAVAVISAFGLEEGPISSSLSGDDADDFGIGGGILTFKSPPDYEAPTDEDSNNQYRVTVETSNETEIATVDITVLVVNTDITLSVSPTELSEENSPTDVTVTATLDGGSATSSREVTLSLDGSATGTGIDYVTGQLPTIMIDAGSPDASENLSITPVGDDIVEGIEAIIVKGTAPGFTVTPATIYLRDQNTATLSLSGPTADMSEGDDVSFTVTHSHAIGSQVRVAWSVTPGTATSEDYRRSSGQVTFPAGSEANDTQSFTVSVRDDSLSEGEESFIVSLGTITGLIADQVSVDSAASSTTMTVSESDPITVVFSGPVSVDEGDTATYTVSLSPTGVLPTAELTVDYATLDGTAGSNDYTAASGALTFTSSDAGPQSIIVSTTEDSLHEGDQTFSFTLSNVSGGGGPTPSIGSPYSLLTTISDDDSPPSPPRNSSPRFDEGTITIRTVPEDAEVGMAVGDPVNARDSDNDRLEYWLRGMDRASFDVDPSTGQLTTKTALDYEVKNEYSVRVSARDRRGGVDGIVVTISVENVDEPPARPAAPDLKATSHSTLAVNWTAPDNQGTEITDYDLQYREANGELKDAGYDGTDTSIKLNNLKPGTRYEVQVRAINAEGTSPWSESGRGETKHVPPPPTPTPTPTPEPTATATPTPEPTATAIPTPEPTATATPTPEPTATATPTPEPTATAIPTPEPTATATPTPEPTATVIPTPEPTATATPTPEPTATATPTPEPTATAIPTPESTTTPTAPPLLAPAPTSTLSPPPTSAPIATATPAVTPERRASDSEGGLPWWVILLLSLGSVGVVLFAWVRRRRRQG